MFEIRVMNYLDAFNYVYNHSFNAAKTDMKKFSIISIQDAPVSNMGVGYKSGGNCLGALNLWFSDVTESGFEDAKERHPNWLGQLKLISDSDANKIKEFMDNLNKDTDILIVHCRAGQSRSAGVAAALSKIYFGDDSYYFNNSKYTVNMTVYYKVLKAFGLDVTPSFGLFE
jgi:rhodanese-related sulfurtransferase